MTRRERPQPPTVPGSVVARRVLVLAPHYDDEVLGCGGLLLQLAASDAEIVCAFLSDGSGGAEGPPEGLSGEQYSALRRVESEAATADLGVARVEHVGHRESLPDGGLVSSMGELTGQIGALLDDIQPDLVLVPFAARSDDGSPGHVPSPSRGVDRPPPARGGWEFFGGVAGRLLAREPVAPDPLLRGSTTPSTRISWWTSRPRSTGFPRRCPTIGVSRSGTTTSNRALACGVSERTACRGTAGSLRDTAS